MKCTKRYNNDIERLERVATSKLSISFTFGENGEIFESSNF